MFNTKALKERQHTGLFRKRTTEDVEDRIKSLVENVDGVKRYILIIKFADYNSIDDSRDKMVQGCFDSSWEKSKTSNRKIGFLWQHDRHDPIGRIIDLWDDEKGAYVKVQLSDFDAVPNAKRTWYQVQDGTLNQASFGYRYNWEATKYVRAEQENEDGHFLVGEVILREISIVTFGDNENTEVVSYEEVQNETVKSIFGRDNVKAAMFGIGDEAVDTFLKLQGIEKGESTPIKRGLFGR